LRGFETKVLLLVLSDVPINSGNFWVLFASLGPAIFKPENGKRVRKKDIFQKGQRS